MKKKRLFISEQPLFLDLVGAAGFELATPCTPCKCATRLRYAPKDLKFILACRKKQEHFFKYHIYVIALPFCRRFQPFFFSRSCAVTRVLRVSEDW